MKNLNQFVYLACVSGLAVAGPLRAAESNQDASSRVLPVLSAVTTAELPSKSAELVAQADADHQADVTKEVVKAAVGLNPAAASAIVGAIAKVTPDMAAIAAAMAAQLVPDQAAAIARAAAAAAPKQVAKIVAAVCQVMPSAYRKIGEAVASVLPGSTREILAGIEAGIPQLKDAIEQVLPGYKGDLPSVSTILAEVSKTDVSGKLLASTVPTLGAQTYAITPVVSAPYVTPPSSPSGVNPGSGGTVPTGGRNDYVSP